MRKRKHDQSHGNHERWIVSYADFVTLLFAFFVVMFATANSDKGKAAAVSASIRAALDHTKSSNVKQAMGEIYPARDTRKPGELTSSLSLLQKQLKDEINRGEVSLRMDSRGLTISFNQAALFNSGEATLKSSASTAMETVAGAILKIPNEIRLEGHTDNIPIHTEHFRNNWELSSSRSIAVLQMLTEKFKVPAQRLAVSGYADVAPIASNDTEEGRTKNRRVDIVILSMLASKAEPDKAESR